MNLLLDIDHTISDAAWRDGLVGQWEEYHSLAYMDEPVPEVRRLVRDLWAASWTIIGLTARPEKWRQSTMEWTVKHRIPLDHLLMRPNDDYQRTPLLKVAMYQEFVRANRLPHRPLNPCTFIIIDDRDDVTAAFNAAGVTAMQISIRNMRRATLRQDEEAVREGSTERASGQPGSDRA